MKDKLSICVFIKDNNSGAFGLWESMATLMPLADEFFVLDLGSIDGTYEILKELASKNKKIRIEQGDFPVNPDTGMKDAGSFAMIPNQIIPECKYDTILYYQADEVWHENLVNMMSKSLDEGVRKMTFWRYQLKNNFQKIKWFPHLVHRVGVRGEFVFNGDGMNTEDTSGCELISNYNGGWFARWGSEFSKKPHELPTHEMILDISSLGGFLENIKEKRKHHAPYWREREDQINLDGAFHDIEQWYNGEKRNPDWTKKETHFNIPDVMKPHLGELHYQVRQDLLTKIADS